MSKNDDEEAERQRPDTAIGWQSDVIVDLIKRYDFPYITLNPGATFRGLHDSLVNYGDNQPPMLLCQHEKIAVQIAHGYAKASGKPMVVIVHNLVGLLHATMAIYYAYIDRVPIFIMGATGPMDESQAPPAHRLDPHRQWCRASRSATTSNGTISRPTIQGVPEIFARAYSIMTTEPQGPIYMCYDAWLQEAPLTDAVADAEKTDAKVPVADGCPIRPRWRRSPTGCGGRSIRCCSPNMSAAIPAASTTSSHSPKPSAPRSVTSMRG